MPPPFCVLPRRLSTAALQAFLCAALDCTMVRGVMGRKLSRLRFCNLNERTPTLTVSFKQRHPTNHLMIPRQQEHCRIRHVSGNSWHLDGLRSDRKDKARATTTRR